VTVDIVVFAIVDDALHFLIEQRTRQPARGEWALPEGFVGEGESLDRAARRVLEEEAGVGGAHLEQLYTFGEPGRDPRGRVISVAYLAVVPGGKAAAGAPWRPVRKPPALAFDHGEILQRALERLRTKTEYSTLPLRLLPDRFTLSEVQRVYEILLERPLDKRNFRRKMLALDAIEETDGLRREGAHRPARLFRLSAARPYLIKERGILFPF
jgi:8-oxo-dGTP diphosphatase